jgi:Neuraminidase (sialidase)
MHAIVGTGHPDHLGVHYSYSDDTGKNWSIAMQLGDESAVHSDIASHDNGRVVAIWDMMSESGLAIFVAESTDQGNHWSEPKQLSKVGMRATHPRIIKTKNGFLAVWTETDGHQQILTKKRL